MDWTATDSHQDSRIDFAQTEEKNELTMNVITEQPKLPVIPAIFDDETFEEPEPIIIKNSDDTLTKYTWKIICDPKADPDNEFPDQVCIQTKEHISVKKQKVNKNVAFRRTWAKYGSAKHDGIGCGAETQVTSEENAVPIILFNRKNAITHQQVALTESEEKELLDLKRTILVNIKQNQLIPTAVPEQGTWDARDLEKGKVEGSFISRVKQNQLGEGGAAGPADGVGGALRRPTDAMPGRRPGRPNDRAEEQEGCTVRVSNLSDTIMDGDIQDLFGRMGAIRRTFLAKHKNTGKCKGYAFVTYASPSMAEKAVRALDKHAFHHLILNVELAKNDRK